MALSAAGLIAAASTVLAQGVLSKAPGLHHKLHPRFSGYASRHEMQAYGVKTRYPEAFG